MPPIPSTRTEGLTFLSLPHTVDDLEKSEWGAAFMGLNFSLFVIHRLVIFSVRVFWVTCVSAHKKCVLILERENKTRVQNAAGSVFPLCNKPPCQCPGVGLCHQEWYLSLVQKIRRHVEHNKEQEGRLQRVATGNTVRKREVTDRIKLLEA